MAVDGEHRRLVTVACVWEHPKPRIGSQCWHGTCDVVGIDDFHELTLTFVSKLRFATGQSPEPGDAVLAHVLDLALGEPKLRLAYRSNDGDWSCAETGEALMPHGARRVLMEWLPSDDLQEQKYRVRFGR